MWYENNIPTSFSSKNKTQWSILVQERKSEVHNELRPPENKSKLIVKYILFPIFVQNINIYYL